MNKIKNGFEWIDEKISAFMGAHMNISLAVFLFLMLAIVILYFGVCIFMAYCCCALIGINFHLVYGIVIGIVVACLISND